MHYSSPASGNIEISSFCQTYCHNCQKSQNIQEKTFMSDLDCYKNPMKALSMIISISMIISSASAVGRIGNDKVSDICGQLLPLSPFS